HEQARHSNDHHAAPIVFEGNAPADVDKNPKLAGLLALQAWPPVPAAPLVWLGEPVAIKDPTAISFRRQSGANVLIIGQQEESALAMMAMSMIALAAQHPPKAVSFQMLDGTPADSQFHGVFARVASAIPHQSSLVEWRAS